MAKNNKTRFFYVLYSDKTQVFDQSKRVWYPTYTINIYIYIYMYTVYIYISPILVLSHSFFSLIAAVDFDNRILRVISSKGKAYI